MSTNTMIEKRSLGKTGILVSPVGLGMMEFSGGGNLMGMMFPVIPQEEKNAIVKAALDGGINWFDTAEAYGGGESERSLAAALQAAGKSDEEVVVATKWLPIFRTAGSIPRTIKDRIHFLYPYNISLYMVHNPMGFSTPEMEMRAMAGLVSAGKIRSVGVSNFSVQRMRRAYETLKELGLPLAVNQVRYSLLHRTIETNGILETAKELGVTIIAYTPLESGLLSGKYHKDPGLLSRRSRWARMRMQSNLKATQPLIDAMEEMAQKYNATVAQVALNWVINFHGDTIVTIPGATKVHQAQESAGAMQFRMTEDELARLDEVSKEVR
jgi:aryl-alcohol dehydrogenase-like predicted oxidoreductase